jgi:nucleoside-diphosphate-sugar epimerase
MSLKVLILGVNGFIGSSLAEYILTHTDWQIYGLDLASDKLGNCIEHPNLHFTKGDMLIQKEWISEHIKMCDVVLPLVAIANPAIYVQNPLKVFELDFEANLDIIRQCVRYQKRVVFPSTSEVYGMCPDSEFDEHSSNFVTGPTHKTRWIYSTSKQLLDRVIYAYGEQGLQYTLFRPFNWIGPKLDNILNPNPGGSRALTQFIGNILRGQDITLVDGGAQRRTFIYIEDGIEALARIIANQDGCANQRIFNIGNPNNNASVRELAELLIQQIQSYPKYADAAKRTQLINVPAEEYYGKGYQDVGARVPSIKNAQQYLNWQPRTDLVTAIRKTLDFYLEEPVAVNA